MINFKRCYQVVKHMLTPFHLDGTSFTRVVEKQLIWDVKN